MMVHVALIVPNNLWVSPYLSIYTRQLKKSGVDYEIISWNRANVVENCIQYNVPEGKRYFFSVFFSYFKYARFVKKILKKEEYDRIIVFSSQLAIFLAGYLKRHYWGRYIIDFRDLSIEQKKPFDYLFKKVLQYSYANVISSPGFKDYLPLGVNYIISHNFNVDQVNQSINEKAMPYLGRVNKVLTIGALRTDMNIEVMNSLGNHQGFELSFVGKGTAAEYLENYSKSKGFTNVFFTGFYNKEEEPAIYEQHALVNIIYPLIPSHISALSNRFYNSLIYKRPMIVASNTVQGDYAVKYGVGLVVDNCENLSSDIVEYNRSFDFKQYVQQCNSLLSEFLNENKLFEKTLCDFVR